MYTLANFKSKESGTTHNGEYTAPFGFAQIGSRWLLISGTRGTLGDIFKSDEQLNGKHVHRLSGEYVGKLHKDMVVDEYLGKLGNIGNPGKGVQAIPEIVV